MARTAKKKKEVSLEASLWASANRLRGSVSAGNYKYIVLGLVFLKYANDRFTLQREQMIKDGKEAFLEMMPFYTKDNVFFIPECARWSYLMENAKQSDIVIKLDTALHEIEEKNLALKGTMPSKFFSEKNLDANCLSSLLDIINSIDLQREGVDKDVFGKIYEYCLSKFALPGGDEKSEFYTPKYIVSLISELIEPFKGIVYDGACGSGGMFVQSVKFINEHCGSKKNVSIYGQEVNGDTLMLAKMNLAIRGISANLGETAADTFINDQHPDLKADFVMMNPPFNFRNWRSPDQLLDDPRWEGYTVPPVSNANYGWLLHILSKLNQNGVAGVLLANGALSGDGDEAAIRKQMIENDVVEAIILLPGKSFYTTDISSTLWILNKNKKARKIERNGTEVAYRDRSNEILFMDLRQKGHPYEKKYIELTEEDRKEIADVFHAWRQSDLGEYQDIPEFCYAAKKKEVAEKDYSLVPSRYIEFVNRDEAVDFDTKMKELQSELSTLLVQEEQSKADLLGVFKELGYEVEL